MANGTEETGKGGLAAGGGNPVNKPQTGAGAINPGEVGVVNLQTNTVNLGDLSPSAVKTLAENLVDTDLFAGILATRLTKQISFEFNKDGGILKTLALGPAKAISDALVGFSNRVEGQFESLIDATQKFRQAVGGGGTQVQALEQLQTGREFLGTSFADIGVTPENVLNNIASIRGATESLSRLLSGDATASIASFQGALEKLGVKDVGLDKFQNLVSDLEKKDTPRLVKRFKQLTAVALGLSKTTGRTLNASFQTVFEEANKLTSQGIFDFNRLEKAIIQNSNAATRFGVSVPGNLNKVLPSFQEVFGIAKNLNIALRGFTIDPKSFLNQTGAQRLESIFQSFRRAREAGSFQIEERGMGRDQQVAFLSRALQGTGLSSREIQRLLQLLEQGQTTLIGTGLQVPTEEQTTEEILQRAGDTRTREELRRTTGQRTAEDAAIGSAEGRQQIGRVIEFIIQDIDKITDERADALAKFGSGLRDTTSQFLRISELAKQFGAADGPATFSGILAYSVFGPPGTFEKTIKDVATLGKTTERLFGTLQSREGTNLGTLVDELKNSPLIKQIEKEIQSVEKEASKQLENLKNLYTDAKSEIITLKNQIINLKKQLDALSGRKTSENSNTPGDETRLNAGNVREMGKMLADGFVEGIRMTS